MVDTRSPHPNGIEAVTHKSSKVKLCFWSVCSNYCEIVASDVRFLETECLAKLNDFIHRNIHSVGSGVEFPLECKLGGWICIHVT